MEAQVMEIGGLGSVPRRSRFLQRLIFVVVAVNVLGILCLSLATQGHSPLGKQGMELSGDASLLDSLGFTLMLPGIFFASIAFLCAPLFAWSDGAARVVWYASGFAINLLIAWKAGAGLEAAPEKVEHLS